MINNLLVSEQIIDDLIDYGVTHFVVSPGSRSTPLTVAIARHSQAKTTMHFDERGAAYFALGVGRATGIPAVLVCTSGTAVANYLPAVVEASMDNIPLIVLTADRPPELIDVGANQAIFQQDIFGIYPRLARNLTPPTAETSLAQISVLINQIYHASVNHRPGPVHLNCQFREPLLPDGSTSQGTPFPARKKEPANTSQVGPPTGQTKLLKEQIQLISTAFEQSQRGIIVVGRGLTRDEQQIVLKLAVRIDVPIFPDVQSQLRFTSHKLIVNHFDLILLAEEILSTKPDFVIHFGSAFTSKRLLNYLNSPEIYYVQIKSTPETIDPNHQINLAVHGDISDFCQSLVLNSAGQDENWLTHWQLNETKATNSISNYFKERSELSEPAISFQLAHHIPDKHALMLANSMPIRDMEMFADAGHFKGEVFANRGSSGIDGLLATTAGIAAAREMPVTLLIGDLAFLHDLNSLALIVKSKYPIFVILINNDGGGIFHFLPIRQETDVFEPFFGTPHGLKLAHAAELFNLNYANPKNMADFLSIYKKAVRQSKSFLIELDSQRDENHLFHQQIFESIRETIKG